MNPNEIRPDHDFRSDDEMPSLRERIGDNKIERGIPTDLNVKSRKTMTTVLFLIAALVTAGVAVAGILNYSGDSDTQEQKAEEIMDGKAGSKNFASEKEELELATKSASAASAAEPAAASTPKTASAASDIQPAATVPASEPETDERLDADLSPQGMDGTGGSSAAAAQISGSPSGGTETDATEGGASAPQGNPLTAKLRPGTYQAAVAENRGDLTYVLNRGTGIPCVTTTRIVTTHPGLTRCQVTRDVYSANGKTLLVERGSTIIGEQTSALTQGQARVFVLWNTLETPNGVRVALDSPGGDALGASGHPAKVKHHFWRRIGGAVMISMIQEVVAGANNRQSNRNTDVNFESTTESAQDLATEVLKNSINIPPTGYVNQGTEIMVFAARDVDFSGVYENVTVSDRY
ncbi:type IV secretion system protein VirB10 [Neisseria sp.]|uniref:type IV secretion system protein VirB10 n=1 Tax=Neisseria sp. TaxID=192066 RepID=UPI0035A0CC13